MEKIKEKLYIIFLERWHPYFCIFITGFMLYCKTLAFRFTGFDDVSLISDNFWFINNIGNIFKIFTQGVFLTGDNHFYRPLLTLSFMVDANLGGISPFIYHLTNILLHISDSILLFILFIKMAYSRKFAFLCSILFVVHPALSQAVAWIPGRNDSLLALFILLSFIFFIDYVKSEKIKFYYLNMIFFLFALFTKETAATAIIIFILYNRLILNNSFSKIKKFIISWLILLLFWIYIRSISSIVTQTASFAGFKELFPYDLVFSLIQYFGKIFLPFNLSVLPISKDTTLIYGLIAIFLVCILMFFSREKRKNYIIWGLLWFLIFIIPPFFLNDKCRLEHRLYLPMIGIFFFLAELKPVFLKISKKIVFTGIIAVFIIFFVTNYIHSDNFIANLPFWKNAVKTSPNSSKAHNALAVIFLKMGENDLSEQEIIKALKINPYNVNAITNMGINYMDKKMLIEAEKEFFKAAFLEQGIDIINLGRLRCLQNRFADTEQLWLAALKKEPNNMYIYKLLAAFYSMRNDKNKENFYVSRLKAKFGVNYDLYSSTQTKNSQWLYDISR